MIYEINEDIWVYFKLTLEFMINSVQLLLRLKDIHFYSLVDYFAQLLTFIKLFTHFLIGLRTNLNQFEEFDLPAMFIFSMIEY